MVRLMDETTNAWQKLLTQPIYDNSSGGLVTQENEDVVEEEEESSFFW